MAEFISQIQLIVDTCVKVMQIPIPCYGLNIQLWHVMMFVFIGSVLIYFVFSLFER